MTVFAKPEEDDLVLATGKAIAALRANRIRTEGFHDQVRKMYSWTNVAERTERVYDGITGAVSEEEFYGDVSLGGGGWSATRGRAGVQSFALIDRLKRYYGCGIWAGKLFCLCVVIDFLLFQLLEMVWPRGGIDVCRNWPRKGDVGGGGGRGGGTGGGGGGGGGEGGGGGGGGGQGMGEEMDEAMPLKGGRSRAAERRKGRVR